MSIAPVQVGRVSLNLRTFNLLNTVRGSQVSLYRVQNQLSTGLRFQTPSEDPLRSAATLKLDRQLDKLRAVGRNLETANATLAEGESALAAGIELTREAYTLALEATNASTSPAERAALGTVVNSLIERLSAVGNREHLGTFLFSGHRGDSPFVTTADGVLYQGDRGRRETIINSDQSQDAFTIPGDEFFGATSLAVQGFVDLDPQLTADTRISDLGGALGTGVALGRVLISDGSTQTSVDLSSAATIGDVIDRLNAEMPETLLAGLTSTGISISAPEGPASITIEEAPGGATAVTLGIIADDPVSSVLGADLNPRVTGRTRLSDLNNGAGVLLDQAFVIRNGGRTVSFDLSSAQTMEDVLNAVNGSNAGVWAQIAPDGAHLNIVNRLSGSDLRIEETGGLSATALGIRSLHAGTRLSSLNDGLGVQTVQGADFRITTASGATVDIDLDVLNLSTATLEDVINVINAAGDYVTASLNASGNGLTLTDQTLGGGTLRIERLNVSPAIDGLGLNVGATGNQLIGQDVNPARVDGVFTGLIELRTALSADDGQQIGMSATRLKRALDRMEQVAGGLAGTSREMLDRRTRLEDETSATQVLRSDAADADFAETIVRFQQLQTALQANLQTAGRLFGLSLLDYLR